MRYILILCLTLVATPLRAHNTDAHVISNMLAAFYHVLSHAVIDKLALSSSANSERDASMLSVMLIHRFYEENAAADHATDTNFGFVDKNDIRFQVSDPSDYWRAHGTSVSLFNDLVCVFYGGNPVERNTLSNALGLSERRKKTCVTEFERAFDDWEPVLDELEVIRARGRGEPLQFRADRTADPVHAEVLRHEVWALNKALQLPAPVDVTMRACNRENVSYMADRSEIVICTEYLAYLAISAEALHD
ncbi:hypothetical protein LCGC14_2197990 [marine sediment metagenome]|uniref:Uncharacterized protein n=1 Tax=marine sediment metagenome TaxID=412755 RepID=A0A0F9GDA6_9ZZZZ